jgi:DNA-binding FadR family transcriptional regulator
MSVADRTIQKIRDLIASGQIGPGERLPAEPEFAARLNVSRNSLREAIRALCEARVLEVRRGDGTFVSSLEPETLLGGLGFVLDLMRDNTVLEIFEVRRIFEPPATGLAALRATEQDVADLTDSLQRMREATTVEELISYDYEFHRRIMQTTGNATLCTLMDALGTRAMRARIWRGLVQGGVMTFTLEQHGRIVDAVAARDPSLAAAASTVHVSDSERWLRRLMHQEGLVDLGGSQPLVHVGDQVRTATTGQPALAPTEPADRHEPAPEPRRRCRPTRG